MSEVGPIRKMQAQLDAPVRYALPLGEEIVPMNERIGKTLHLEFMGAISCIFLSAG